MSAMSGKSLRICSSETNTVTCDLTGRSVSVHLSLNILLHACSYLSPFDVYVNTCLLGCV